MVGVNTVCVGQSARQRGRYLRINPNGARQIRRRLAGAHALGRNVRMIQTPRRVQEARRDVIRLQVREVGQDLFMRFACCEQLQHVDHAHAHPADARTASALLRTDGDTLE